MKLHFNQVTAVNSMPVVNIAMKANA